MPLNLTDHWTLPDEIPAEAGGSGRSSVAKSTRILMNLKRTRNTRNSIVSIVGLCLNFQFRVDWICKYHDLISSCSPCYWPFQGIHRSPLNSPHKGQWRGDLMFSLFCTQINGWINNDEAGDLKRLIAHYDFAVMKHQCPISQYRRGKWVNSSSPPPTHTHTHTHTHTLVPHMCVRESGPHWYR